MISKWKLELLAFLTSLTLISVGFSSWQITSGPVLLSGTIQASPVQKASEYIKFNEDVLENTTNNKTFTIDKGIQTFEYNETLGFVNVSNPLNAKNIGAVTLNYQINVDNCRGYNGFDSFIMRDKDLDGLELKYLQLNVTINLRDGNDNYDSNALNQFLNYAPISVTSPQCTGVYYNGTTKQAQSYTNGIDNDFFAKVIDKNVVAFLFPISTGTDDTTNEIMDKIALTFHFVASSENNAKAAAAYLEGREFAFQTAFKGLALNEFSD